MGQSTNAILFYGVCWDEEMSLTTLRGVDTDEEDADDEHDWQAAYATAKGCPPPQGEYDSRKYQAYLDARGPILDASPCEVGTHCSYECAMPYVFIKKSEQTAHRGYPKEVGTALPVGDDWDDQLRSFCKTMGIDIEGKRIGWWLVSLWG